VLAAGPTEFAFGRGAGGGGGGGGFHASGGGGGFHPSGGSSFHPSGFASPKPSTGSGHSSNVSPASASGNLTLKPSKSNSGGPGNHGSFKPTKVGSEQLTLKPGKAKAGVSPTPGSLKPGKAKGGSEQLTLKPGKAGADGSSPLSSFKPGKANSAGLAGSSTLKAGKPSTGGSRAAASAAGKMTATGLVTRSLDVQQTQALGNALGPNSPLFRKIVSGQPLTAADIATLKNLAGTSPQLASAINQALLDDRQGKQQQALVNALQNLNQGWMPSASGQSGSGGSGFPSGSAVCMPVSADEPDGAGMVMAVNPSFVSAAEVLGEDQSGDIDAALDSASVYQTTRHLRVTNATREKMTVYLQYRAQDENEEWLWSPGEPGSEDVMTYELEPGEVADLADEDWHICASRVRLWAVSANQTYEQFKDQDLWLVPETDRDGTHLYESPAVQTIQLAIR
jgi:hypothetical protein